MKKYAEKFIAQEIDMDTVIYLNENHLEQLGVTTIGARLRILAAINSIKGTLIINNNWRDLNNNPLE